MCKLYVQSIVIENVSQCVQFPPKGRFIFNLGLPECSIGEMQINTFFERTLGLHTVEISLMTDFVHTLEHVIGYHTLLKVFGLLT